jgi:Transmembrane domain of unknown function (DUF3566)
MKRRIKRIAPLQAGKMLGVLYACMGLIFLPFIGVAALAGAFAQQAQGQGSGAATTVGIALMIVFGLFVPIIYGVMGFLVGVIGAAIYNFIAQWIGGIEVEVE